MSPDDDMTGPYDLGPTGGPGFGPDGQPLTPLPEPQEEGAGYTKVDAAGDVLVAGTNAPGTVAAAGEAVAEGASAAADVAGGVLEAAGGLLDGCGGCSLAVLLFLGAAGAAVAAVLR